MSLFAVNVLIIDIRTLARCSKTYITVARNFGKLAEASRKVQPIAKSEWKVNGLNGLKNVVLKHLPKKVLVALTKILNACLRTTYFPAV